MPGEAGREAGYVCSAAHLHPGPNAVLSCSPELLLVSNGCGLGSVCRSPPLIVLDWHVGRARGMTVPDGVRGLNGIAAAQLKVTPARVRCMRFPVLLPTAFGYNSPVYLRIQQSPVEKSVLGARLSRQTTSTMLNYGVGRYENSPR